MSRWPGRPAVAAAVLGAVLAATAPAGAASTAERAVGPREGMQAPDAAFRDLKGREVTLAGLRGRVVVLNFWATWCTPCIAEMPDLERLWADVRADGVTVLAVNLDVPDPRTLSAWLARAGIRLPVVTDPGGASQVSFDVNPIPMTVIIDKWGVVRYRIKGARRWTHPDYAAGLRAMVAEAGAAGGPGRR